MGYLSMWIRYLENLLNSDEGYIRLSEIDKALQA